MLHVLLKHLLLFYLKKFVKTNKLLTLSTKTQMHVACFFYFIFLTFIIILSKCMLHILLKHFFLLCLKKLIRTYKLYLYQLKLKCIVHVLLKHLLYPFGLRVLRIYIQRFGFFFFFFSSALKVKSHEFTVQETKITVHALQQHCSCI